MQNLEFKFKDATSFTGLVDQNGNPWFIVKDICNVLGIQNSSRATEALDDDEKLLYALRIAGQKRDTWITNESGLYCLIFKSKKPEARAFQKWVTSIVLPEIRKTGSFNRRQDLETSLNFQIDIRKFRRQINSAAKRTEKRIAEIALGKVRNDNADIFGTMEKDWEEIIAALSGAVDRFSEKLKEYKDGKPIIREE